MFPPRDRGRAIAAAANKLLTNPESSETISVVGKLRPFPAKEQTGETKRGSQAIENKRLENTAK